MALSIKNACTLAPKPETGIIIMSVSLDDWAWSRLIPFVGFPVIKTHDWGCFLGGPLTFPLTLGRPLTLEGLLPDTKTWIRDSQNGFPR